MLYDVCPTWRSNTLSTWRSTFHNDVINRVLTQVSYIIIGYHPNVRIGRGKPQKASKVTFNVVRVWQAGRCKLVDLAIDNWLCCKRIGVLLSARRISCHIAHIAHIAICTLQFVRKYWCDEVMKWWCDEVRAAYYCISLCPYLRIQLTWERRVEQIKVVS